MTEHQFQCLHNTTDCKSMWNTAISWYFMSSVTIFSIVVLFSNSMISNMPSVTNSWKQICSVLCMWRVWRYQRVYSEAANRWTDNTMPKIKNTNNEHHLKGNFTIFYMLAKYVPGDIKYIFTKFYRHISTNNEANL